MLTNCPINKETLRQAPGLQNWPVKGALATQGAARPSPRGWQSPWSTRAGLSAVPFSKLKDTVSAWISGSLEEKERET